MDLIYSQSRMLYKILSNIARAEIDPTKTTPGPHADGVISSAVGQVTSSMRKVTLHQNPNQSHSQKQTSSAEVLSTEASKLYNQPNGKKGRNKKKTEGANLGTNNNDNVGPNKKRDKLKLCPLCEEPHLTINFPKLVEARRLLGQNPGSKQPTFLFDPFPNQGQQIVAGASQTTPHGGNQTPSHQEVGSYKRSNIYRVNIEEVNVQTRTRNYDEEPQSKEPIASEN